MINDLELEKRMSVLETKVFNIEDKIEDLKQINTSITKLTMLFEISSKDNMLRDEERRKSNEILDKQSKTLEKINYNLDGLNNELKETNTKVKTLEATVDSRIQQIELKFNKSEEIYKVDVRNVTRDFISKHWYKLIIVGIGIYEFLKASKII